jgi:hypothetical protein
VTYKQFKSWCNERACDGRWGMNTALACIEVMKQINRKPFWKREKEWQKWNRDWRIEEIFVTWKIEGTNR